MINKLELLKQATGEDFEEIICNNVKNENYYKCENGAAFIIEKENSQKFLEEAILNEIPFLPSSVLKEYLPEKFHNEIILDELKELCKFGHTILSNFFKSKEQFYLGITSTKGFNDFFLDGSERFVIDNHEIYYSKN